MTTLQGEILVGHDYIPDWIDIEYHVSRITSEGNVKGEFYSGHKRTFKIENFRKHFTHNPERCILCEIDEELE